MQGEGGPGPVGLVPPGEEGRKVDDAAAEDRPELLLQVGPVPELGHEDAEGEVVAEGAEHQAVLVAVSLAQVVKESGWRFNVEIVGLFVGLTVVMYPSLQTKG